MLWPPPTSTLFPYTTLFRSPPRALADGDGAVDLGEAGRQPRAPPPRLRWPRFRRGLNDSDGDRKSTRLNSSHTVISYAVFCLKKKSIRKILEQIQLVLHKNI